MFCFLPPMLNVRNRGQKTLNQFMFLLISTFSPQITVKDMAESLTPPKLLEFINEGGNMIVAAHSDVGPVVRELGSELGLEFAATGEYVLDHFHRTNKDASRIQSNEFHNIVSEHVRNGGAVEFHGIGHVLNGESPLSFPVLTASRYGFTGVPNQPLSIYPFAVGRRILLVSGFQARKNSRVLILGTHEMLSNT